VGLTMIDLKKNGWENTKWQVPKSFEGKLFQRQQELSSIAHHLRILSLLVVRSLL
jgi:hypothetical protein